MKQSIFIFLILLFSSYAYAQRSTYDQLWLEVEKHELEGLPKSALKVVEQIYAKANKDENHPQAIKTLLFKSKFALTLEEDAQLKIINDFKKEIEVSSFPINNVLESILADLYWQYFQQNRWKFYNRTKTTEKINKNDFRTWDLETIFEEIHFHFKKSLNSGLLLQLEPLEKYSALLTEQKNSKLYRPTLFDFLSHNALDFYKSNETHINKPAYKFEIDNPKFIADSEKFSVLKIESKDSTSLQLNALKIYQDLVQFHLKDKLPFALVEVNIERLNFVQQHATFANKQDLFLKSLQVESDKYKGQKTKGLYDFEMASVYLQQSQSYKPKTNEIHRWKAKEAIDMCNNIMTEFPESKSAEKSTILKYQIEQQTLRITTEEFLPVQKHARLLINYKNLDYLKLNAYKLSQRQIDKFGKIHRQSERWEFIQKLDASKTWESRLKNESDFQSHSTEISIPKLNNGRYLVVATTKDDKENTFAFAHIQITNMALVNTNTANYQIFQIIDRNNGKPISNADVEVSYYRRNERTLEQEDYTTNRFGEVKIEKDSDWYRNVTLKVKSSNEVAYFAANWIGGQEQRIRQKAQHKAFLFTDRSIYRPGQTVYFKSIVMRTKKGKSDILPNETIYATLYNVNDEDLKELELKTNEFGSISGEFILPNNGLNGQYYIELDADDIDINEEFRFSVEEYKRPKFETKFIPITETFKINDSISIIGNALAYAGSNVTNAKVVYRVHRQVQYPHWHYWYRPNPNSEAQEITHGETTTDASGNFKITFKALADKSVSKSSLPIFKYEVTADVIDLNGETRSAKTIVNVGYHALTANLSIDNILDKTKKDHILNIDTKNLNGEFVPAKGSIKIYKLKAPSTVLRPRPWSAPDYQEFSKEAFKNLFPHDAFLDEDNPNNWKKGELVMETAFNTEVSKTIKLNKIKKWVSGSYLITLESKDKFGQLVKDEIKTTLYSDKDKTLADQELFNISTDKPSYKNGETAYITLASASENIWVTFSVEKDKKIIQTEVIELNSNKRVISIPVTQGDTGGFAVHYSYAAYNSFNSGTQIIPVPYPKTNLEIETLTFRDRLQPGTDETWEFKIKGAYGEKVSAEFLASMYDASLDQFKEHNWNFSPITRSSYYSNVSRRAYQSFGTRNFRVYQDRFRANYPQQAYDQLNWFGFSFGYNQSLRIRGNASVSKALSGRVPGVQIVADEMEVEESILMMENDDNLDEVVVTGMAIKKEPKSLGYTINSNNADVYNSTENGPNFDNIKIRTNLQETAFFFPKLKTDEAGNVSFSFTTPESLTQWKLQLLAHTKLLESASKSLTTVTQKELMVIPNAPRFLREGDKIFISTKIANLTEKLISGQAILLLTDGITGNSVDMKLDNTENDKTFSLESKGNTEVSWLLTIPDDVQVVQYKVVAKSDDFSDGEQNALPVLNNRILVTETLPMWVRSNQTKTFTLDKLKNNSSSTLKHHKLTLEMTSNPAWYAVQALPYLMEYPYECNEQTFSRYYANALASHIANSNPRIQEVFNQWRNADVLISNLEKNQELKSILIQETPWLRDVQSETEQKKRIALLFDLNKMNNELQSALNKLKSSQMSSGGWPWFNGGYENRYITQHIIAGFGHLKQLNVTMSKVDGSQLIQKAINYLDNQFIKEYKDIRKYDAKVDLNKDHLSHTQLHYLYMRSFFNDVKKSKEVENIINYYQNQIQKYWLSQSLYSKGLMALISYRNNDEKTASKILKSLKETSVTSDELGMYWKSNTNSWHWYQAQIETQALMIEVFSEAGSIIQSDTKNLETIDNLKIWLLKNKQTNQWKTTKSTTEAVYALLLQGSDWLSVTEMVEVVLGGQKINPKKLEKVKIEAGTGYYKTVWKGQEIAPEMGEVTITKKEKGIAWSSLYWQYFEDLDNITAAETPLSLKKKLFKKTNTDKGEKITEITSNTNLKIGDLVRVRIELKSDRNMEFLHMKDMRASGLEPVNVISKYKWQDGLGYYESTKDASINFFFSYLPKGVYVFEYDLRINNSGDMSNGITTIQSMYAPEFSSHSEGVRIDVF